MSKAKRMPKELTTALEQAVMDVRRLDWLERWNGELNVKRTSGTAVWYCYATSLKPCSSDEGWLFMSEDHPSPRAAIDDCMAQQRQAEADKRRRIAWKKFFGEGEKPKGK